MDSKKWKKLTPRSFRAIDIRNMPDTSEARKYLPLCNIMNAVERLAGTRYRWMIVANHAESADVDHRPDLARFPLDIEAATQAFSRDMKHDEAEVARCAWAWMSSVVEVKNTDVKAAFHFAPSKDKDGKQKFLRNSDVGRKSRAQFIKYAIEAMLRQHRTHFYSFCWDRVGCVASEPINLGTNVKESLNIVHRLATSADAYISLLTIHGWGRG